jgi:hypothetical protein
LPTAANAAAMANGDAAIFKAEVDAVGDPCGCVGGVMAAVECARDEAADGDADGWWGLSVAGVV